MPHPLEAGTIRILKPDGSTAGTGFLVSKRLAMTCAHVIESAHASYGDEIKFKFHLGDVKIQTAKILKEGWSIENDVAIMELIDKPPKWIRPITMQSSQAMEGRAFQCLGYPNDGVVQTRWAQGNVSGFTEVQGYPNRLLQIQGKEIDKGLSGSAIVDRATRRVIGMITAYQDITRPSTAESVRFGYAIPIETAWKIYPELEKELPPLPKRSPLAEGIHLLPHGYDFRIQSFLTEYLGTPEQPEPFGGREDTLKKLDEWLDSNTQRLLLAAPAGRGKSALLVRWLDRLIVREDIALVFLPVSVRFRTNLASTFFASLAARLAYLHSEDIPTNMETSTDVWRGLVNAYLAKPLANGKKLLVVLDGLDEAGDWEATADLIPTELPNSVHIVISARFLAGDTDTKPWLLRLGWEHVGKATTLNLDPLDSSEVADVLLRMGVPLDVLSRRVDIISELYRLSEGDPLLVNLYVEDLWSRGHEASKIQPEDLQNIKPGYEGYFDRWWKEQKKIWGNDAPLREKSVQLTFNLLCGAMGALTKNDLMALDLENDLTTFTIEDAIDELERFVIGIPDMLRKAEVGYVLSHPKLRDYFWDNLDRREKFLIEKRFISYGEQTLENIAHKKINLNNREEIPVYIIQYYGAHLKRAQQPIEKFMPIIHHEGWARAWFAIEGSYGGYLQDVRQVREQCRNLDLQTIETSGKSIYLACQFRCALIEASIHNLAGGISAKLIAVLVELGIWTLSQALVFINQMPEKSLQSKAMIALIPHLKDHQLLKLLETAQLIEFEDFRHDLLNNLISRLPKEALQRGLEAVRTINDKRERAHSLLILAQRSPEIANEALDIGQTIVDERNRTIVLLELVKYHPEVADEILKTVRAINDEKYRADVLIKLTSLHSEVAGKTLEVAQTITNEELRAGVLIILASYLPDKINKILEEVRAIKDEKHRLIAISKMAQYDPEVANEVLEGTRSTWYGNESLRVDILTTLAQHLPDKINEILKAIREIENNSYRASALSKLVHQYPEIASEALEAARTIWDKEYRANTLIEMAKYLPELASEALAAAKSIPSEGGGMGTEEETDKRDWALRNFAECLWKVSLEQALEAACAIDDYNNSSMRNEVLKKLVQHLPQEELWRVLDVIQDKYFYYKKDILDVLAPRLPEESLRHALEVARNIENTVDRADTLTKLSRRSPEVVSEAVETATQALIESQKILDKKEQVQILTELVQCMPEKDHKQVLDAIQDTFQTGRDTQRVYINDEVKRDVLNTLTHSLPESELIWMLNVIQAISKEDELPTDLLLDMAKRLPEDSLWQVLEITQSITNEENRVYLLSALIQRLPKSKLNQVLKMIRDLNDPWKRLIVLIILAQRKPRVILEAPVIIWHMLGLNKGYSPQIPFLRKRRDIESEEDEGFPFALVMLCLQMLPNTSARWFLASLFLLKTRSMDKGVRAVFYCLYVLQLLPEFSNEALKALKKITSEEDHGEDLFLSFSALVYFQPETANKALKVARSIRNEEQRIKVLIMLVQYLPDIADEVIKLASSIIDEHERYEALKTLTFLPEIGAEFWTSLGKPRTIGEELYRLRASANLVKRQPKIAIDILKVIWMIEGEEYRAKLRNSLEHFDVWDGMHFSEYRYLLFEHLKELTSSLRDEDLQTALEMAQSAKDNETRVDRLIYLVQHIPSIVNEVLEASRNIADEEYRVIVTCILAQVSPEIACEALEMVWATKNNESRDGFLKDLVHPMLNLPRNKSLSLIEASLDELSRRKRSDLLSDSLILLPVLLHLGDENTATEIYNAIKDVVTWWQ